MSRGWSNDSVFDVRVGSLALSPLPKGGNVLAVTKPCVSVRPAPSQGLSDARRSETSQSHPRESKPSQPQARRCEDSRNRQTSQTYTPGAVTSLVVFLLQVIRQGLSSSADCITVNLLSQSEEIPLEVSR
jgi:hypothetical protein